MSWKPEENAWNAYIKFEEWHGTRDSVWQVLEDFIDAHPLPKTYIRASNFEKDPERKRLYFERAIAELGEKAYDENFFINFTWFETKQDEYERAWVLYKFGLEHCKPCDKLKENYIKFEKQYGSWDEMEDIIITRWRDLIMKQLEKDEYNYDLWIQLA